MWGGGGRSIFGGGRSIFGGVTSWRTVWVRRWGRACFRPTAESSDGVVERGWGVVCAVLSAAESCDGVDEHVFMVDNQSKILICRFDIIL